MIIHQNGFRWNKLTSAIISVDRNTINIAFVLLAFWQTNHQWVIETSEEVNLIVTAIIIFNLSSTSSVVSIRNIHNSSTELSTFSDDWFINRTVYRTAVKTFHSITTQYCLLFQYRNYLSKQSSKSKQKQLNSSDISSSIDDISSQSKHTVFQSKIKYFTNIDDNLVFDRNNKKFISTIHSDFDNQLRSINQQVIETFAEKTIYDASLNFIMSNQIDVVI